MSKHNYSKYYDNNKKTDYNNTVASPENKMAVEPRETTVMPIVESVETVELPKLVKGTVANCTKLNVRMRPASDADVVCILDVNSEVEIDVDRSNRDWFAVSTAAGIDGYCMKAYINAKL